MFDKHSQEVNYLRISVTDRCNLRCRYCIPQGGVRSLPSTEILSYEEIEQIASWFIRRGVRRIRLTGGEPLVRKHIWKLVNHLADIPGLDDLSMTTNGTLLKRYTKNLVKAGLMRVNISLDTLREDRFHYITRGGNLKDVLQGIEAAKEEGLLPIKINVVVMRGFNEDEIFDFANLANEEPLVVRFIEWMNTGGKGAFVPNGELMRRLKSLGELMPISSDLGGGPAEYFRFQGAPGIIGFISPVSKPFCRSCNRLRLNAQGELRPCIFENLRIPLKGWLRARGSLEGMASLIQAAVEKKRGFHDLKACVEGQTMCKIGG